MTQHISTTQLHDYVDDMLGSEERAVVEMHLKECSACRNEREEISTLVAQVGALPESIMPMRDLRPGIAARLSETPVLRVRKRSWLLPALATAAALVLVTAGATRWWLLREQPAVATRVVAHATSALPVAFRSEEGQYVDAIAAVQKTLDRDRARLSPVTIDVLERNMAIIDHAIVESRAALASDPANRDLSRLVLSAYQQKLELLRRARTVGL
jgi:anti-sigma factor RsiW